jgi:dTDP-L-rhamnose 4-epimerase
VYGEGGYRCQSHGQVRPPARSPHDLAAGKFEPRCPGCGGELATAAVRESEPLDPRNGYAASKVAQEHLAAAWARATQGSALALRYHNVYGPRMPRDTPYAGVAAIFRSALAAGQAPEVFEDGKQLRDFVHVRDVAQANLLALRQGQPGKLEPFNIASGEPRSIGEMAATLTGALGGPEPLVTGEFRAGDVRHIMASPAAAAAALGFRAEVAFADGMAGFATAPLREPAAAARVSAARRDQPAAG